MTTAMLTEVVVLDRGTSATANVAIAGTVIPVEDITQFDAGDPLLTDVGDVLGTIDINGLRYDYIDADEDTLTITLATGLTVAVDAYDPILVVAGGEVAKEYLAFLDMGEGDSVTVPLPYSWRAQLPEGPYDPPVPVNVSNDLTTLLDAPGRAPVVDGSFIDGTGLPDPVATTPPDLSPTITAYGMPSSIVLKADPVAGSTLIEYHVSTSSFTPVAGDPDTLVGAATRSLVQVVTQLPDGTLLQLDTETSPHIYYFHAIAINTSGSAAPSPEVVSKLDPTAVATVVAEQVVAGFVLAGAITVGGIMITPGQGVPGDADYDPGGIQIDLANGGQILLPADGSSAQFTKVLLEATSLLVYDNLEVRGTLNRIAGQISISAAITTPSAPPTVSLSWADGAIQLALSGSRGSGTSLADDGTNWVTPCFDESTFTYKILGFNKTTGVSTTLLTAGGGLSFLSAVLVSGDWYVLATTPAGVATVRKYNTSWVYSGTSFSVPATTNSSPTAMAADGTTLYVAYIRDSGTYDYKMIVKSMSLTGTSVSTVFTSADSIDYLGTFWVGAADFGATRFVVGLSADASDKIRVYSSAGARVPSQEWTGPYGVAYGLFYDGTNFRSLVDGSRQKIYKLSRLVTATTRAVRWSKYDSDGTTHETAWSTAVTINQLPRTYLRVTTPPPEDAGGADDPNAIRHYIQSAGTGSYWRQADVTAAPWTAYYGLPTASGSSSVSSPDFSGVSNPGVVKSAAVGAHGALIELGGDGTGRIDKMLQSGLVTITPVANTPTTLSVVFDVAFDAIPVVQVTAKTAFPGTQVLGASANNVTTTGFDVVLTRTNTTNTDVGWTATARTQ